MSEKTEKRLILLTRVCIKGHVSAYLGGRGRVWVVASKQYAGFLSGASILRAMQTFLLSRESI